MNSPLPDSGYFRAAAFSTLITSIFAFVWGLIGGLATFGVVRIICVVIVCLVTLLLFSNAFTFFRIAGRLPTTNVQGADPFRNRLYQFAAFAQFVVIFIAARILTAIGSSDAIISAVAIIVGLHFFALVPAFQSWRFAAIGSAMIVLGLASLLLAPTITMSSNGEELALRRAIVGLGCAIILWAGVVPFVRDTQKQARSTTQ